MNTQVRTYENSSQQQMKILVISHLKLFREPFYVTSKQPVAVNKNQEKYEIREQILQMAPGLGKKLSNQNLKRDKEGKGYRKAKKNKPFKKIRITELRIKFSLKGKEQRKSKKSPMKTPTEQATIQKTTPFSSPLFLIIQKPPRKRERKIRA